VSTRRNHNDGANVREEDAGGKIRARLPSEKIKKIARHRRTKAMGGMK